MSFEKAKKVVGKPLDKAQSSKYTKQATETKQIIENKGDARFCLLWTLTTEEWKAELELERIGKFWQMLQFLSMKSFNPFTRVEEQSANKPSNNLCSLDRAHQCSFDSLRGEWVLI